MVLLENSERPQHAGFRPLTGMVLFCRELSPVSISFRPLTGMVLDFVNSVCEMLQFSPPYGDGTELL